MRLAEARVGAGLQVAGAGGGGERGGVVCQGVVRLAGVVDGLADAVERPRGAVAVADLAEEGEGSLGIFAALNYLYCDVLTALDPVSLKQILAGNLDGMEISQGFLLGAAILVEIPIAMTLVSRLVSKHAANRWANIVAGSVMTVVQFVSLFVGTPSMYYLFFSVLEIACTSAIVWCAWRWRRLEENHATASATATPAAAGTGQGSRR